MLLDGEGRRLASWPTFPKGVIDPLWERLSEQERRKVRNGFAVQLDQSEIPEASLLTSFVGLRGASSGILRVDRPQGMGPLLARRARLFSYWYAAAVMASLGAVVLFTRWVTRPYRLILSRAAERAGVSAPDPGASAPEDLVGVFQSILERMQQQEQALASLRGAAGGGLDEAVINSMGSGVLLCSPDGQVRRSNRAASRLLGLQDGADADALTRRVAEIPDLAERLRECARFGMPLARGLMRLAAAGPGGGGRHLGVSVSPVRGASGEVEGMLCLFSDLTEIHTLEERARARDNLAAVGELSAGIAHEFRNALHTIDGYARLVEREAPQGGAAAHAQAIRREASETGQVVEEFLRFARPVRLARAVADLSAMAREAGAEMAEQFPSVRWRVEAPEGACRAEIDATLLRGAIQNLLRNAAEAVAGRPDAEVLLRLSPDAAAAECVLEVRDNGPGIDPRDLAHLFTPFFTTRPGGTGLGLPLARKAILAHDGEIEVDSKPGAGSTFRVRLPVGDRNGVPQPALAPAGREA
jgi:signal transduction histidine kinase